MVTPYALPVTTGGDGKKRARKDQHEAAINAQAEELQSQIDGVQGQVGDLGSGKLDKTLPALSTLIGTAATLGSPADADTFPVRDSESGNVLKRLTWTSIKAALKTYFDGFYPRAAASAKASPVDADIVGYFDSEAASAPKRMTWANVKAFLKTYFDGIYLSYGVSTKDTPVDADRIGYFDSEAGNAPKRMTWANIKTALKSYFDGVYPSSGVSSKSTPIDADIVGYFDSEASNAPKRMTLSNLKSALKTYFDTLYLSYGVSTKDTPADADRLGYFDSEAGNVPKRMTWSNVKTALKAYFDGFYPRAAASAKATPVDADIVGYFDSEASSAPKRLTWANIKAFLKAYFDALYSSVETTNALDERLDVVEVTLPTKVSIATLREVIFMDSAWNDSVIPLSAFKDTSGRWVIPTYLKDGLFSATGLDPDFLDYIWSNFQPLVPVGDVDLLTGGYVPLGVFKNEDGVEVMPIYLKDGLFGATGLDPDLLGKVWDDLQSKIPVGDVDLLSGQIVPLGVFKDADGNDVVPTRLVDGMFEATGLSPYMLDYVAQNLNETYTNGTKLRRVYNALAAKVAPVIILGNGESWEDSPAVPQAQADILYERFGKSAQGHMSTRGDSTGLNGVTQILAGGWAVEDIALTSPTRRLGIDGYATHTTLDTGTWVYGTMDFDEVFVFYDNVGSGTFRAKIDGTVVSTVVGNGTATSGVAHITSPSSGVSRVFALDTVGNTGEVSITDVFFFSSTLGVAYCKAGNNGTNAQQWAWISARFVDIAASIVPDMLQLRLGINDINQNTPIADFKAHLTTYINNARAAWPGVEILLCMCPESGGGGMASRGLYAVAMRDVAKANDCEFFDGAVIGPYAETSSDGLWLDTNHLNAGGARSLAFHQHRHFF